MPLWKQLLLTLYYEGTRPVRAWNYWRLVSRDHLPAIVLYYHRIADDRATPWTISNAMFVRQLDWLGDRFDFVSLAEAQQRIRRGYNPQPCVSITFDDGYADNCQQAIPWLVKHRIPCTYFVTLRNVLGEEPFSHDLVTGHRLYPNTLEQLRAMAAAGIEIGAHTYTHANLGPITDPRLLRYEVVTAKEELQAGIGRPIRYFAFPFGHYANLNPVAFALAQEAGYAGVCSAYGGFNFPGDDPFHLQRIPVDDYMIRLKNWVTADPRKLRVRRFEYRGPEIKEQVEATANLPSHLRTPAPLRTLTSPMPLTFDNPEYPGLPAPLATDTLADSVLILLALTAVQRLVGFVRAVLFCRWLDAKQLGLWDMAFGFLLLAAPLAVLAIPGAFGRYLEHYRRRGQLHVFLRWSVVTCGGLATAACLGIVLARRWFAVLIFGEENQANTVALAAGCLITVIAYNFLVELFTALRNIRLVSVMQLVNSIAFAVLGIGLLLGWQCTAQSVLLAYGGSCLIAAVWAGCRLPRVWHNAPPAARPAHATLLAKIVPFAAWILLANALMNLFEVVDRYMIVHFSGASASQALDLVGNYHSSRVVPMLLVSIATMLGAMITPHLSHDWEAGRRDLVAARLRLFVKLFGFALFAGGVAVLLAAPLLFGLAFRNKFPGGEAVLPWTLVYCTWFGLALILQNYILCAEKARLSSVALACGLVLNVLLNLALLPRLGLEGAVLSTAAANALSLGLVCLFNHRLGFHLDDGAKLVLVLPMLLCLGPWAALLALVVVAADAIWGDRLLSAEEKRQLSQGAAEYGQRLGLTRVIKNLRAFAR